MSERGVNEPRDALVDDDWLLLDGRCGHPAGTDRR